MIQATKKQVFWSLESGVKHGAVRPRAREGIKHYFKGKIIPVFFYILNQVLNMEKYGHVLVKAFTERVDGPGLEAVMVNYKALHDQVIIA